ncbi:hypothetical protein EJV46_18890 [Roseococcus sp. SYP-B2431]|uniref:hypothetical protein n=1 Tax=Roseococcus sp. SYP-B2431 TaxID=2496640 RepID=UPI00103969EF|nr:hypothetical protein [Roseococcus sp. SYP-B2431]TCH96651.1 hypothetical protein EJV46_18890 [Roseococcus sp. SYP-B2431]
MRTRHATLLFLALTVLSSCAQREADHARTQLVGTTRAQILECMGRPGSEAENDGLVVWSYSAAPGSCRANLTFREGRVTAVRYLSSGSTDQPDAACAPLVRACLAGPAGR